jgi:hypothetical protein
VSIRRDIECRGKLQYIAKLQSEWSDGRVTAAWNVLPPELTSAGHSCLVSARLTQDAVMERNRAGREAPSARILESKKRRREARETKIQTDRTLERNPRKKTTKQNRLLQRHLGLLALFLILERRTGCPD